MSNIRVSVAAATAVVNYDLVQNEINALLPESRVIKGFGLVGSAAAGDTIVELMVGNKSIGKYENSSTGTVFDVQKDIKVLDEFVPANTRVQAIVRDAAATNPVVCLIEFGRPARASGTRRRRSYRGTSNRGRRGRQPRGMY